MAGVEQGECSAYVLCMNRRTIIYAWLCPLSGKPAYVGKTSQPISDRMRSHWREARKGSATPKHDWLRDLSSKGMEPRVIVLEETDPASSPAIERRWTKRLARFCLLNVASAGSGNPGVGRVDWTPNIDALLGTVPDSEIAARLGCERKTVSHRRKCLSIEASFDRKNNTPPPSMGGWNKRSLADDIVAQLGTMPDYRLAELAGVSKPVIRRERTARGIPSYAEASGNNGRIRVGEPHRRWTRAKGNTPPARPPIAVSGVAS